MKIMNMKGGEGMKVINKKGFLYEINKNRILYAMFLPAALFFIIFVYAPLPGIVVAFKEFNYKDGIYMSPWNNFSNFKFLINSGTALTVVKNTVFYNLIFLAAYTFFSVVTAIFIAEMTGKLFKKITQTFMFLPYFISWVTVTALMYNIFGYEYGAVNGVLRSMGMEGWDIYSNPGNWTLILPILYVWKWIGFGSVLYLSSIMGIDHECYESATIDGANLYHRVWYITLPMLKPTVVILILLGIGRIMRGEFDMFYQLIGNNGMLFDKTDIIDTLVFRSLVGVHDFGMASAAGFMQSIACFVIIMVVNGLVKKYDKDYALF